MIPGAKAGQVDQLLPPGRLPHARIARLLHETDEITTSSQDLDLLSQLLVLLLQEGLLGSPVCPPQVGLLKSRILLFCSSIVLRER